MSLGRPPTRTRCRSKMKVEEMQTHREELTPGDFTDREEMAEVVFRCMLEPDHEGPHTNGYPFPGTRVWK